MKIYLSACYRRQPEMQRVGRELETFGHEITSRWISEEPFPIEEHRQPVQARAKRAQRNLIDLAQSDCLIAFTERPPSGPGRGGRHVELGIALANRLRTMVVGWQENLFHTLVEFYPSWEEAKCRFLPPPPNLSLFAAERPGKESLTAKSETS
jgi:hypothetical protein